MDSDVQARDQAAKEVLTAVAGATVKVNGLAQAQDSALRAPGGEGLRTTAASRKSKRVAVADDATNGTKTTFSRKSGIPLAPGAAGVRPRQSRPVALTYIGIALTGLLFIGACGPVLSPKAFNQESGGVASSLSNWAPLPQGMLLLLLLGLVGIASALKRPLQGDAKQPLEIPAGVTLNEQGFLCDRQGSPLPRGIRLAPSGQGFVVGPNDTPLPQGCVLGAGGVLVHAASGRPVPHSCRIGDNGQLLSSTGEPLPDSMGVGPNSTLLAVDGTVLSPDLQPVPAGFSLSACGKHLLRPNGKPVPRGVHVGPGFRLLKPNGDHLPDGVKIGPCGSIICVDGTILCSDGNPAPAGFALNPEKTVIADPQGRPVEDKYSMGPNGTLISQEGELLTALGKQPLPSFFSLGPLGNLLIHGEPVPASAYCSADGQLVMPDGQVVEMAPDAPCSGQEC